MRNKQVLPIPFLIFRDDSLQIQTVEQERMAAFYFRVLSWLSDLTSRTAVPARPTPQRAPAPQIIKTPQGHPRPGRVEFCALRSGKLLSADQHHKRDVN